MKYLPAIVAIGITFCFYHCGNTTSKPKPVAGTIVDSSVTCVLWIADWRVHDYRLNTAKKFIQWAYKDVITDSSGGTMTKQSQLVKDSFYLVPIYNPVLDSLKKPVRTLDGKRDSVSEQWVKLTDQWLLQDYGRRFK